MLGDYDVGEAVLLRDSVLNERENAVVRRSRAPRSLQAP